MPTDMHRSASHAVGVCLARVLDELRPVVLGGYWPIRREYNPLPLMQQLREQGTQAALPAILEKNAPLEFRLWHPGVRLAVGAYDIPYPADGVIVIPDTLLVPLVGFDFAGYRLGYGGGYFDRTLAALEPRPRLVGIGFESGRLPTIYPQGHDIRMDRIVTEAGALTF
jgi:5-formyltetrahydrofolate cyclo-ligase